MPPKVYKKKYTFCRSPTEISAITARYLVIVESPSKCAKIENYLGPDYKCIASMGHIREISGIKAIDVKNQFLATFTILSEKKEHVKEMRRVIDCFLPENIILASDDDREGEAIAWHICEVFHLSVTATKRILFHEITKPAILKAIETPTKINMSLVRSQQARQILDILVGFKISPILWKYVYYSTSNSLSAGRCQTPALRLIYDNSILCEEPVAVRYKTLAYWRSQEPFELHHEFPDEVSMKSFLGLSKMYSYHIRIEDPNLGKTPPPKPFTTSGLLQKASNILHYSPKETMSLCQKLYQNGLITYMRTDSVKYSDPFLDAAKTYIQREFSEFSVLGDLGKLKNTDTNQPHEAIRVTNIEAKNISVGSGEDPRLASLYKLIWKNTIQSCMSDYEYKSILIKISAPQDLYYRRVLEIPMLIGWKILDEHKKDATCGGELLYYQSIQSIGQPLCIDSNCVARNTHSHYSEATLIQTLEDLGIGRPSTFATIVETIQDRGYVKKMDVSGTLCTCVDFKLERGSDITEILSEKRFGNEKQKLVLQSVGKLTVEFLIQHFENFFSYDYTKRMEEELDQISTNTTPFWYKICETCLQDIQTAIQPISKISKQSWDIDDEWKLVFQESGPTMYRTLENGDREYKSIRKDIQFDFTKIGGYTFDDLVEIPDDNLGEFQGEIVYLKTGQYGPYVKWGETTKSVKEVSKPIHEIRLDDVIPLLSTPEKTSSSVDNKNIIRSLTEEISIRRGKYGAYIYYQRKDMGKPEFYNLKSFGRGYSTCEPNHLLTWILEKYPEVKCSYIL